MVVVVVVATTTNHTAIHMDVHDVPTTPVQLASTQPRVTSALQPFTIAKVEATDSVVATHDTGGRKRQLRLILL